MESHRHDSALHVSKNDMMVMIIEDDHIIYKYVSHIMVGA